MNKKNNQRAVHLRKAVATALRIIVASALSICWGADVMAKAYPETNVRITVSRYRMISGEERYKSLQDLIPMSLQLQLDSPGWSVAIVSTLENDDTSGQTIPSPGVLTDNGNDGKAFSDENLLNVSVSGTFLEVGNKIRVYSQIRRAKQGDLLASKSITFGGKEVLTALGTMANQIKASIQAHLPQSASLRPLKRLMVMCFQPGLSKNTDPSFGTRKGTSWLGLEISHLIAQDLNKTGRFDLVPENGGVPACTEKLDTLLVRLKPDMVIAGEYHIGDDAHLNASARIVELSSNLSIGPITVSGESQEYFRLGTELSESIRQILSEAMDENGELIIKGTFSDDVSSEEYYAKGRLYLADRYEAIAILMFTKALEKNKNQPEIHLELARIFQSRGDLNRAIRSSLAAIEGKPDSKKAHFLLGELYFNNGDLDKAYDVYSQWLAHERSASALIKRGHILLLREKFDEAMQDYQEACRSEPRNPETHTAVAAVYMNKGMYVNAADSFKKALSGKKPPDAARQGLARAYLNIGIEKLDLKKSDSAIAVLKKSIKAHPTSEAYGRLAQAHLLKGNIDNAFEAAESAVKLGENRAWPHAGLGRILYQKKDYHRAIEELTRAIEINPKHGFAHLYLGKCYHALGQNKLAIGHLETTWKICLPRGEYHWMAEAMDIASRIDPSKAEYAGYAGDCYRMIEQYDKAIDRLGKAVNLNPGLHWARGSLGISHLQKKEYHQAINELGRAVDGDPKLSWAHAQLGIAYGENGDDDKAIESMHTSLKLNANQPWLHYRLAQVYLEKKQNSDKALEHVQQAIKRASRQPGNPQLIDYRSSLPEILITLGRYGEAIEASEKVFGISTNDGIRLNMLFANATALLLQKQQQPAMLKIKALLTLYSDVSQTYTNEWIYNGILAYVDRCDDLDSNSKKTVHAMTRLLEGKISNDAFRANIQ